MKRITAVCAALVLFVFNNVAGAETAGRHFDLVIRANPEITVSSVEVRGKFNLDPAKARELSGITGGELLASLDPDAIEQRYLKSGLFSDVVLSLEPDGDFIRLVVTLEEKRTLVYVPMLYFSSTSQLYGLFIINANFLGTGTTLVTGGFGSTEKQFGMLILSNQLDASSTGYQFVSSFSRGDNEANHADGDQYRFWYATEGRAKVGLILPVSPYAGFMGSVSSQISSGYDKNLSIAAPSDSLWVSPGVGVYYRAERQELYFSSGVVATLGAEHGFPVEGERQWNSGTVTASLALCLPRDMALKFLAAGEFSDRPVSAESEIKGMQLLQGPSIRTDRWATARTSLEYPFAKTSWGVFTLGAFYEAGAFRTGFPDARETGGFQGPGGSFTMYLRKVAIPALGITAGWNSALESVVVSAALGMQMR